MDRVNTMSAATKGLSTAVVVLTCISLAACGSGASNRATVRGDHTSSNAALQSGSSSSNRAVQMRASKEVVVQIAGRSSITKGSLEHWMAVGTPKIEVPQPPDYTACITRLDSEPVVTGQAKPTAAQLKGACERRYHELKQRTLDSLIATQWLIGEAERLGLKVSDEEINRQLQEEKRRSFPTEAQFQKFLTMSGQTLSDVLLSITEELVSEKIRQMIKNKVGNITRARIAQYYNEHKHSFAVPERRDIEAIRTWTKAAITRAEMEVRSGRSFADVARRVSIDSPSNEHGGATLGVIPGQEEKGYDEAIFAARPHVLTGPLYLRRRYYVFEVTRVIPGYQKTFAQVQASIARQLPAQLQQQALVDFIKRWRRTWTAKTSCRTGYVVQKCKQYKVSATTPKEDPFTLN